MPLSFSHPIANDKTEIVAGDPAATPVEKAQRQRLRHTLPLLATRIFNTPLAIHPAKGDAILSILGPRLGLEADCIPVAAMADDPDRDELGYTVQNHIAVIPIQGTLVKKASGMDALSGLTSYEELTAQIQGAMADSDVQGILFDVDSPGGESAGMFDLCDYIHSLRGEKPMYAVSNDSMYSAAYAIGSAADQLYVTREGGMGSVGCYMLHVDQSARDKQNGLKFKYLFAGQKKVQGNPHEPLAAAAEAELQAEVNRQRDMFVTMVARNRNCTAQQIIDLQAGCVYGAACVPLLADKLGNCSQALADLMAELDITPDPDQPCDPNDPECPDNDAARMAVGGELLQTCIEADGTEYFIDARGSIDVQTHIRHALEQAHRAALTAIPPHKTTTSDASWDGPANETKLKNKQTSSYYRKAYAYQKTGSDGNKKGDFKYIHHFVSESGDIGAASIEGCRSGIANLNGARSAPNIPSSDRKGIWNHLAKHLRDAGIEPAPLKSEAEIVEVFLSDPAPVTLQDHFARLLRGDSQGSRAADFPRQDFSLPIESLQQHQEPILALRAWGNSSAAEASSSRLITCCVAPYNQLSTDLGGFKEIYQPGCFKHSLDSGDDARCLFNHNSDHVLGRRSANTAQFYEKPDGLYFEVEAPETSWAEDLLTSMRRGDITGGSSAFFILKPRWEYRAGEKVRVIEEARLVEGSVASFPIYETSRASVQQPALEATALHPSSVELLGAKLRLLKLR